jgi:ArsR family transcriptional regulator
MSVNQIVGELGQVSQPTVSHHLAVLREAGLVKVRNEGKQTFYSLNQEAIASCCGNLIQIFAPESEAAQAVKALE